MAEEVECCQRPKAWMSVTRAMWRGKALCEALPPLWALQQYVNS